LAIKKIIPIFAENKCICIISRNYARFYDEETVKRVLNFKGHGSKIEEITNKAREKGSHVYLIIDEYDNFTNTILSTQEESDYHKFTHAAGFYREAFKVYKPSFERIFMTGVAPVTLADLTSGFNIATNVSFDKNLNDIVGFSEKDVREMVGYYNEAGLIEMDTDEIIEDMRPWYDGYCFSRLRLDDPDSRMYNPNMVLSYISNLIRNGLPPENLVDDNSATDFNKLKQIITIDEKSSEEGHSQLEYISVNGSTPSELKKYFTALQMTEPEYLPSLMYYYGMLTWSKDPAGWPVLAIPNINARKQYYDYMSLIIRKRMDITTTAFERLAQAAGEDGDWQPLFKFVANEFHAHSNARIEKDGEFAVQLYMLGLLNSVKYYLTLPEAEMNGGYCDLMMSPRNRIYPKLKHCYVVELKYIKPDAADTEADRKMDEAKTQAMRYAASPNAIEMSQGTTIHPIAMLFKGTKLARIEEVRK